jgi:KaiC/GvpD/RAD55 family RecA-like ATPase
VQSRGKLPIGAWKQYQTTRAPFEQVLQWSRRPSNVGIVTGAVSGLLVLDLDSNEAIEEARRRGLPDTVAVRTGKGLHVYLQHPPEKVGNRAALLPGMDIRGDGGFVVAPGSVHPSGATYEWENPPGLFPIAAAPGWLTDLLQKPEPIQRAPQPAVSLLSRVRAPVGRIGGAYGQRALANEIALLRSAAQGKRNEQLNLSTFALSQLVAGDVLNGDSVQGELRAAAEEIGLEAAEIEATMTSAWSAGMTQPRGVPEAVPAPVRPREAPQHDGFNYPIEMFGDIRPALENRFLIDKLLLASPKIVIIGQPGCGKSFFAIDASLHIAAGTQWFGRDVTPGLVVYIAAEGQAGVRLRVAAWKQVNGASGPIPFALIPTAVNLLDPEADVQNLVEDIERLQATWGAPALIVVDTLSQTFGGGDENGSDMAAYVANVARVAAPFSAATAVVHHQPLESQTKRPRGHGSLWGAADTVLHVEGAKGTRRITIVKQKDIDPGADILFDLKSVEIGTDQKGEPVTSCVIELTDSAVAAPTGRRLSAKEKIVLDALDQTLIHEGFSPPPTIPSAAIGHRTFKVANAKDWRANALAALAGPDIKPDTIPRTFLRCKESLQAAEILGFHGDYVWLTFKDRT